MRCPTQLVVTTDCLSLLWVIFNPLRDQLSCALDNDPVFTCLPAKDQHMEVVQRWAYCIKVIWLPRNLGRTSLCNFVILNFWNAKVMQVTAALGYVHPWDISANSNCGVGVIWLIKVSSLAWIGNLDWGLMICYFCLKSPTCRPQSWDRHTIYLGLHNLSFLFAIKHFSSLSGSGDKLVYSSCHPSPYLSPHQAKTEKSLFIENLCLGWWKYYELLPGMRSADMKVLRCFILLQIREVCLSEQSEEIQQKNTMFFQSRSVQQMVEKTQYSNRECM